MAYIIMPAILAGLVVSLLELGFIIKDENLNATGKIPAMLLVFSATLVIFNADQLMSILGMSSNVFNIALVRIVIAFGTLLIVRFTTRSSGKLYHEVLSHLLIVGLLMAGAPYIWPFIENMLPTWAHMPSANITAS